MKNSYICIEYYLTLLIELLKLLQGGGLYVWKKDEIVLDHERDTDAELHSLRAVGGLFVKSR